MIEDIFTREIDVNMIFRILFVLFAFFILRNFFVKIVIKYIRKLADKWNMKMLSLAIDSIEAPLRAIIVITGIFFAITILPFNLIIKGIILKAYRILLVLSISSCLLRLLDAYNGIQKNNDELYEKRPVLKTLLPLVIKGIKFLIILIAVVIIAVDLGYEQLQSLLAGVGIGGLAVAMAAQDLLKNIFGGFVILTDKSFNTGDFIKIDNNEGTVEEVGLRSTKVRTLEQELIIVPNAKFADGAIINYSKRGTRRVKQVIGATYSTTSSQLQKVITQTEKMILANTNTLKDSVSVRFEGFGSSSLDILVMYKVNTSDYDMYMKIKEEINFKIMSIFEENKVEFAFPSVSVYMEKQSKNG